MKKKLIKVIATVIACLGVGAFVFAGCAKKGGTEGSGTQGTGTEEENPSGGDKEEEKPSTGGDKEEEKPSTGGDKEEEKPSTGGDKEEEKPSTGGDKEEEKPSTGGDKEEEKPPVISQPVEGGVEILTACGDLEAAYVTFKPAKNAVSYNVYYTKKGGTAVKLDAPLVREYKDYLRADAVGLAAGEYTLKVIPVDYENKEVEKGAGQATMTVKAHTREGYAFVDAEAGKSASGAYNDDGTLKANAKVIYVTNDNFKKVSVQAGSTTVAGIDNILGEGYQAKKGANDPLCIRIIGSVGAGDGTRTDLKANGDLELKALTQGVTVEGIGNDATANGWGMHITNCSYVEIRNLGFMNMMGGTKDGVGLENKCDHIWVHNCDFYYGHDWGGDQAKGDGALDTKSCTYVTHSYNHFWDSGKSNLQGMKSEKVENKITYHHNWYDHSDSRHPRIRTCTTHIYNNYFDGNAKYGVGVTMGASAFVENNYFRSTAKMKPMMSSLQGTDIAHGKDGQTFSGENGGIIKAFGNKFVGTYELVTQKTTTDKTNIDCYEAATRNEEVPEEYVTKAGSTKYSNFDTANDFYKYTPDSAEDAKDNVIKYAGRIDGGDLKFTFDNAKEDSNYTVIPELKAKLTSYKDSIVKVFGMEAYMGSGTSGGNTEGGNTEGGNTEGGNTEGGNTEGGNTSGATSGNMTATFTISKDVSANDVLVVVKDGDTQIASVKALLGFKGSSGEASDKTSAFEITLKAGYTYTITMSLGSSASARKITINGVEQTTGAKPDYADCVWTINADGDKTITSEATGGKIRLKSITITAVKN